jgi:hypothetical protein
VKKKKPSVSADNMKKSTEKGGTLSSGPTLDPKFKNVICFNCGEPGHYVGLCTRLKRCFMCGRSGHHMDITVVCGISICQQLNIVAACYGDILGQISTQQEN